MKFLLNRYTNVHFTSFKACFLSVRARLKPISEWIEKGKRRERESVRERDREREGDKESVLENSLSRNRRWMQNGKGRIRKRFGCTKIETWAMERRGEGGEVERSGGRWEILVGRVTVT